MDGLDRRFLVAVARGAERDDAGYLFGQGELLLAEGHAVVQEGFAQGGHVAEVDGRSDENTAHARVGQDRDEVRKAALAGFGIGRIVDPDIAARQFGQLCGYTCLRSFGGFQADTLRRPWSCPCRGCTRCQES
ncbi:MAG: hypothetical protein M1274_08970 [Actinobacteria bacterium]|nr:hypothetical protein [Actinomycetota bacterium]